MLQTWLRRTLLATGMIFSLIQAETIPDPCGLLTHQEAEEMMGIPMKEGRLKDGRDHFVGFVCSYFSVDQFDRSGSIKITIDTTQSMEESSSVHRSAKDRYERQKYAYSEALKDQGKADTFETIEGLGDDAYWNRVSLIVLVNDIYLDIQVKAGAGMKAENAEALYQKIEARNLALSKEIAALIIQKLGKKP